MQEGGEGEARGGTGKTGAREEVRSQSTEPVNFELSDWFCFGSIDFLTLK